MKKVGTPSSKKVKMTPSSLIKQTSVKSGTPKFISRSPTKETPKGILKTPSRDTPKLGLSTPSGDLMKNKENSVFHKMSSFSKPKGIIHPAISKELMVKIKPKRYFCCVPHCESERFKSGEITYVCLPSDHER